MIFSTAALNDGQVMILMYKREYKLSLIIESLQWIYCLWAQFRTIIDFKLFDLYVWA